MFGACTVTGALPPAPRGSSNFGTWIHDRFDLPAYRYTGHPAAASLPPGHAPLVPVAAHHVGNDRLVGVGFTNGELSVIPRQDVRWGDAEALSDVHCPDDLKD